MGRGWGGDRSFLRKHSRFSPWGLPSRSGPEVKTRPSSLGLTLGGFAGGGKSHLGSPWPEASWTSAGHSLAPGGESLLPPEGLGDAQQASEMPASPSSPGSVFSRLRHRASCAKLSALVQWSRRKRRGGFSAFSASVFWFVCVVLVSSHSKEESVPSITLPVGGTLGSP